MAQQMVPVPAEVRIDGRLKYRKGAMVTQAELDALLSSGAVTPEGEKPADKPAPPPFKPGIFQGNVDAQGNRIPAPVPAPKPPKQADPKPAQEDK